MFENKVLRKVFGPNRKEVTRGWRILCKGELQSSQANPSACYYSDEIEENEMGGACSMYGGEEMCTRGFCRKT